MSFRLIPNSEMHYVDKIADAAILDMTKCSLKRIIPQLPFQVVSVPKVSEEVVQFALVEVRNNSSFSEDIVTSLYTWALSQSSRDAGTAVIDGVAAISFILACNGFVITRFPTIHSDNLAMLRNRYRAMSGSIASTQSLWKSIIKEGIQIGDKDAPVPEPSKYPAGLLQELERCDNTSSMIDLILKYQMLSAEVVRKESAEKALLAGYTYSQDVDKLKRGIN